MTKLSFFFLKVDSFPLSRKKKNMARDFADAVLAVEICAQLWPGLCSARSYR